MSANIIEIPEVLYKFNQYIEPFAPLSSDMTDLKRQLTGACRLISAYHGLIKNLSTRIRNFVDDYFMAFNEEMEFDEAGHVIAFQSPSFMKFYKKLLSMDDAVLDTNDILDTLANNYVLILNVFKEIVNGTRSHKLTVDCGKAAIKIFIRNAHSLPGDFGTYTSLLTKYKHHLQEMQV